MMVPFGVLIIRVPYYIRDLRGDPTLGSYPYKILNPEAILYGKPYTLSLEQPLNPKP